MKRPKFQISSLKFQGILHPTLGLESWDLEFNNIEE